MTSFTACTATSVSLSSVISTIRSFNTKITVNTQRQVENQGEGPSSSIGQLIILPDSLEQRLISLKWRDSLIIQVCQVATHYFMLRKFVYIKLLVEVTLMMKPRDLYPFTNQLIIVFHSSW